MSNIAIKVEHLSKRYDLHKKGAGTLRDTLANAWKHGLSSLSTRESFWALDDISFEVPHGQVLGIIGRNGAGKSTLLRILSRITPPTKGRVELNGRVASLLEVGTGFHPELSGRENIFLNGAILGMSRAEIRRKFDEIVDFSGVERFLDTPVKHYSSGMYVRLAFAVAAHLEAEILLIDEVLAVGDVEFQRKCLGKMGELAKGGRTVLVVSHNIDLIKSLCREIALLQNGHLAEKGLTDHVIGQYTQMVQKTGKADHQFNLNSNKGIYIKHLKLLSSGRRMKREFFFGEPVCAEISIHSIDEEINGLSLAVGINSQLGQRILTSLSDQAGIQFGLKPGKTSRVNIQFKGLILHPGNYSLYISLRRGKLVVVDDLIIEDAFTVQEFSERADLKFEGHWGIIRIHPEWQIHKN